MGDLTEGQAVCFTGGMALNIYQASIEQASGSAVMGTEEWAEVTDLGQAIRIANRLGFTIVNYTEEDAAPLLKPGTVYSHRPDAERLDAEITTALADEGTWTRQVEQFRITIEMP